MILKGERREDMPDHKSGLPINVKPGDYWRAKVQVGEIIKWEWWVCAPNSNDSDAYGIGRIPRHTVIEHEDRTISVMPDQARDGHMNSILIMRGTRQIFHGWIKRGYWSEDWQELNREVSD